MAYPSKILWVAVGVLCWASGPPVLAQAPDASKSKEVKKQSPASFVRVRRDAQKQPVALETAIVRYVPASGESGLVVELVGAVHVGDRSYYDQLNKEMEQYDVLLYELVAPPGTRIPKGGKRPADSPLAMIQQIAKFVLELDWQTDRIDYTRKNFVHADLSAEQMAEAIKNRGDDGLTLFLSIAADMLRHQNLQERDRKKNPAPAKTPDFDIGSLLFDPEGPVKLKRLMAEQLEVLESPGGGFGPTINTILISDRNQAAMKVFQKELAKGRKKIGIFYGAAHMPDFEKRLREDFGLKRDSERWLTAWDIKVREKTLEDLIDLLKLLDR